VLYAKPLQALTARVLGRAWPWLEAVSEALLLTVAAQLTTLPLMAYYFHQVSLISLLANLLVLPVQPPLMALGGLAVLGGMAIRFWAGRCTGWPDPF
jgi:competence protein ComEC